VRIEQASVAFSPASSVITGDSGVGKSVLLLALNQVRRWPATPSGEAERHTETWQLSF